MDWFDSNTIVLLTVIGAVAFWMFMAHCATTQRPFLNPRLLLDRNFAIGTVQAFIMGMLSFTTLVLFPGLLHDLRGYPDSAIGLLLAARGVGNWLAFLVIVPLTRIAPRSAIAAGFFIQAAAAFYMAQLNINLTGYDVVWTNLLQGFGQSIAFTPMMVMAFSTLPSHQITEGSAIFTLMRNFGASLYISLSVLLLVRSSAINYARLTEYITPYNKVLTFPGLPTQWDMDTMPGLMRLSNEIQRQAAMIGYINTFYLMAFTAAVAVPLACMLRSAPQNRSAR